MNNRLYPQYQKPKRCWKCSGNKNWIPELNKWKCPQCDSPSIPYAPQGYQQQYYQNQVYSANQYPSQYGYQHQRYPPTTHYHGPPASPYQQPYSPYQQPYSPYQQPYSPYQQPYSFYQTNTLYQGMLPGNKTCLYCGNSLRADQNICPKCMQHAR